MNAMGILDRLSTLVKSNLNSAIDKMTDPGKEIDQMIADLDDQLRKARVEVTQALAGEKRSKQKLEALAKDAAEWEARAERAVLAGDDGLAKQALERRASIGADLVETEKVLNEQAGYADQLTAALKAAEARVAEVKSRKETLKAQARARKANDKGAGMTGTSAFDKFDQLSAGVDAAEAENQLDDELAKSRHEDAHSKDVERKLGDLEKNKDLDDRLAALKAKLDKKERAWRQRTCRTFCRLNRQTSGSAASHNFASQRPAERARPSAGDASAKKSAPVPRAASESERAWRQRACRSDAKLCEAALLAFEHEREGHVGDHSVGARKLPVLHLARHAALGRRIAQRRAVDLHGLDAPVEVHLPVELHLADQVRKAQQLLLVAELNRRGVRLHHFEDLLA
jgi:phage shock protein A